MERLRLADLRLISVFLTDLYDFTDVPGFRQRLLRTLPTLVPADRVSVIEGNPRLKQGSGESAPTGAFDGDLARAYGQYLPLSPMLKAYERGNGSAVKMSDFLTQRQLHRLGLYNEYLRKIDTEYLIAKGLPGRPGWITAVYLDRRIRDFSERDRLVLNVLRPHLNQGYRNAVAVTAARLRLTQIQDCVEASDRGLVLLTPDGTVQWMSRRAREWLAVYFGPGRASHGALPAPIARWLQWHTDAGPRKLPQPREPLVVTRHATRLVVRCISRADHTLLIFEVQHCSVPPHALRLLGLTRRETEVLAWVTEGKTSAEIASILGPAGARWRSTSSISIQSSASRHAPPPPPARWRCCRACLRSSQGRTKASRTILGGDPIVQLDRHPEDDRNRHRDRVAASTSALRLDAALGRR